MTNELLFLLTTIVSFAGVVLTYRLFGKVGMWIWMAIATIIANIEVAKCVDMFGLATALGNVIYGSTFLSTDILSENHGEKEAKRSIWMGMFFMLAATLLIQMSLLFIPNESDFVSPSMKTLFSLVPRFTIVSFVCFLISNRLDVFLYQWIGKRTKHIWVKNNAATMIAQFVDTVLYTFFAFVGVFGFKEMCEIFLSAYIMKAIVAVFDTPFLYWAKNIHTKGKDGWLFRRETPVAELQS